MKRIIAMVAFCLLSVSIFAQTGNADIDLIVVAKWGYIEAIKELIEAGADIDAQDNSGWTALIWATQEGHTEAVKALIEAGADLDAQGNIGMTALMFASSYRHTETVKALIEAGANVNAKFKATEAGAYLRESDGMTALMFASSVGHADSVKVLIEAGAYLDVQDNIGMTALMWATYKEHTEAVKVLIEAGADLRAQDNTGKTVLIWASENEETEAGKVLREAGSVLYDSEIELFVGEGYHDSDWSDTLSDDTFLILYSPKNDMYALRDFSDREWIYFTATGFDIFRANLLKFKEWEKVAIENQIGEMKKELPNSQITGTAEWIFSDSRYYSKSNLLLIFTFLSQSINQHQLLITSSTIEASLNQFIDFTLEPIYLDSKQVDAIIDGLSIESIEVRLDRYSDLKENENLFQ